MHRGRLVIVGMLLIGVFAAGVAVLVNALQGRQALNYWGAQQALLIRDADSVLLIRLQPATEELPATEPFWTVAGGTWVPERQVEVTDRNGMLRVREALLDDAAYHWDAVPKDCQPELLHVLVFRTAETRVEVIFDTTCQLLRGDSKSARRDVSIAPTAAFFARWMQQQLP